MNVAAHANRLGASSLALTLAMMAAACSAQSPNLAAKSDRDAAAAKSASKTHAAGPQKSAVPTDIDAQIESRFRRAVMDKNGGPAPRVDAAISTAFNMQCTPAISGPNARVSITLPNDPALRKHVLAVVTPGGKLYELYSPYGDDVASGDILPPSDAITWEAARTQSQFDFTIDTLSGLEPGQTQPFAIFVADGVYEFALVTGIDKNLLALSPKSFQAFAGCRVAYRNGR